MEEADPSMLFIDGLRNRPPTDARDFSGLAATVLDENLPGPAAARADRAEGVTGGIADVFSGLGVRERGGRNDGASACCRRPPSAPYLPGATPGPIDARPRSVRVVVVDAVAVARPGVETSSMGTKEDGAAERNEFTVERKLSVVSSLPELERGRLGGREPERVELSDR